MVINVISGEVPGSPTLKQSLSLAMFNIRATFSIVSREWVRLAQSVFFPCSDLSLLMQWDSMSKTSKNFMSIGVINIRNMKSTFVAIEGACQSLFFSSFYSIDMLTYHRKEWIQYPGWEASQNEFAHACLAFECALDVDPWSVSLWLTYTKTAQVSQCPTFMQPFSIMSREWAHLVQPICFSCSDLSLLMLSPACGSPYSVSFFLCPDMCPSGVVSSRWVLLLADFRSPSRAGGACIVPHHTRLKRDRLSATQNFWNPLFCQGPCSCDPNLVSVFIFGNVSIQSFSLTLTSASYYLRHRSRLSVSTTPKLLNKIECLSIQESSATVAIFPTYARHTLQKLVSQYCSKVSHLTFLADDASILVSYKRTTILAQKW